MSDNDLIRRGDVLDALKRSMHDVEAYGEARDAVFRAATIGAVEVVRCRECKFWSEHYEAYSEEEILGGGWCNVWNNYVDNPEYFCADGVSREDGDGDG